MCYLVENLQATNIKSTSVRLEWEYDRDVKRYWIFRQDDNGDFIVTKTITSHSAGVSVYNQGGYEVFAVVADKNEKKDRKNIIIYNWYSTIRVQIPFEKVKNVNCNYVYEEDYCRYRIGIDWETSQNADYYKIFMAHSSSGEKELIKESSNNIEELFIDSKKRYVYIYVQAVCTKYGEDIYSEYSKSLRVELKKDLKIDYANSIMCYQKVPYSSDSISFYVERKDNNFKFSLDVSVKINGKTKKLSKYNTTEKKEYIVKNLKPGNIVEVELSNNNKKILKKYFITLPNKVENLSVCNITDNSAELKWTTENNYIYYIYIKDKKTGNKNLIDSRKDIDSYKLVSLEGDTHYTYVVVASVLHPETGARCYSEETSISFSTKLNRIEKLRVSSIGKKCAIIDWKKVDTATGYNVYIYNKNKELIKKEKVQQNNYIYKANSKDIIDIIIEVEAYKTIEDISNKCTIEIYSIEKSELNVCNEFNRPTNVHFENRLKEYAKLTWGRVTNVTYYGVYLVKKDSKGNKKYELVGTTKKRYYEFEIDKLEKENIFVVTSIFECDGEKNESEYSEECIYCK